MIPPHFIYKRATAGEKDQSAKAEVARLLYIIIIIYIIYIHIGHHSNEVS